jgi:hypothetical protein
MFHKLDLLPHSFEKEAPTPVGPLETAELGQLHLYNSFTVLVLS